MKPIYQVVGSPAGQPKRVLATFDELKKAQECARFLQAGGNYERVEIEQALPAAETTAPADNAMVGERSLQEAAHNAAEELGEVLFERRAGLLKRVLLSLLFVPLALLSLLITAGSAASLWNPAPHFRAAWFVPFAGLAVTAVFLFAEWHYLRVRFRCHEFGVSQRGGLGTRRLRYDQIDHIECMASETLLLHVLPVARSVTMNFTPRPGLALRQIVFTSESGQDPDPADVFREIMEIVEQQTSTGRPIVQWSSDQVF